MTNGDKIRQMSNEEIAELLNSGCRACIYQKDGECWWKTCEEGIKAYLDMEVE
jgi:hypothetical protein